jgi:hypothetical protein
MSYAIDAGIRMTADELLQLPGGRACFELIEADVVPGWAPRADDLL